MVRAFESASVVQRCGVSGTPNRKRASSIEPAQIEGSEFYNFQLDNIQVGPFGLDNVNVIITSYMKEMAERIDINRLKNWNHLYRGSDTLMMGYLGLNELQYFSVILDLEEKQGFIYTPN